MKKIFRLLFQTVKWSFIVCCVFVGSLFFREQEIPHSLIAKFADAFVPPNLILHVGSASFGFWGGLSAHDIRVYDRGELRAGMLDPIFSARRLEVFPFARRVEIDEPLYSRLPSSYYTPGNTEKQTGSSSLRFLDLPRFALVLNHPDILAVKAEKIVADVQVSPDCFSVERIRLTWPDKDEPMSLDGFCTVDLRGQLIRGEVRGTAKQRHIRPLLVAVDVPSALPYIDAFTEVPGRVPAFCGWKVDLSNNDFDLDLDLDPNMGKYNGVPMRHANGKIHLHVYTRGTCLNYHHTIGPIVATGAKGQPLEGTVIVDGFQGTNTISVTATSALPVAQLLKIGGFAGEYVGEDVFGDSRCAIEFRFPREKCGDSRFLDGKGHVEIKNGQVMRMKGFKGLLDLLAEEVPGVSWLTDTTQASCDYVIKKGILKSDNIYIEGGFYSLKMYGNYDSVDNKLDFTVRVQFTKKDSVMGRIIHPLTWPFTKLLLEFHLTGTSENPKWEYISVIDRVLEVTK